MTTFITSPISPDTPDDQAAHTVRTLAQRREPIDITVGAADFARTDVRYYPESDPCTEVLASAAVRHAYPDLPSVGTLMTNAAIEYHQWQEAVAADRRTPGIVAADRLLQHRRMHLLYRAVALDVVQLQSPGDIHSAAQCVRAANDLRALEGIGAASQDAARTWLRQTYEQWVLEGPHAWDCPGGCGGTQIVMRYYREEGVIVHQEPDECDRGIPADEDGPFFDTDDPWAPR